MLVLNNFVQVFFCIYVQFYVLLLKVLSASESGLFRTLSVFGCTKATHLAHNAHQSHVNSEGIVNLFDFMVNNAPKWRWIGISKHNVLNLAVTIQQPQCKIHTQNVCCQNITSSAAEHQMLWLWDVNNRRQFFFFFFFYITYRYLCKASDGLKEWLWYFLPV